MTSPDDTREGTVRAAAAAATYIGTLGAEGAATFAGIPFAEPPVGPLRFRPPQPVADTGTTIDATAFRPAPAQGGAALMSRRGSGAAAETPGKGLSALAGGAAGMETSEDCLYLNVWTPDVTGSKPVVVWIYGGGFDSGSAAPPITDGAALSRLLDAVVVSISYRVGALGFGHWRGVGGDDWAACSNLGLQDQTAGLAWVRRNIAAFGGDPTRTTVAGESAGAFCIGSLLAVPRARGLFDQAVMHSGSTGRIYPASTGDEIAHRLLDAVGVGSVEELQDVEVDRILAVQSRVIDSDLGARNLPGGRSWGVVLDGTVLTQHPLEAVRDGAAARTPLLMGANRDEARLFANIVGDAWAPRDEAALLAEMGRAGAPDPQALLQAYRSDLQAAGLAHELGDVRTAFLTDAVYRRPAVETAMAQRAAGGHAWSLLFSAEPLGPGIGAGHGLDLVYLFDRLAQIDGTGERDLEVQRRLAESWRAFVHHGDPGWDEYDAHEAGRTRQVGGASATTTEPERGAVLRVWPLS